MMRCNKCGYDWSNSGDSAHVCGPVVVRKPWVGLTEEDVNEMCTRYIGQFYKPDLIRAVEQRLKEKNDGNK
jgi:hypothetical protein